MEQQPTDVLIERFRIHGDQEAFSRLFGFHEERVWAYILSKNIKAEEAESVFQEVGLAVAQFLRKKNPRHLGALVFHITKRKIADFFRRAKLSTQSLEELQGTHIEPVDPRDPYQRFETMDDVLVLFSRSGLSKKQRTAILLHLWIGYSVQEVAQITGVSENTVKNRLYCAKVKIQAYLDRRKSHEAFVSRGDFCASQNTMP